MADIDVVRSKRGTNAWVWIIAIIVLVVIVLAMMGVFSGGSANRVGGSLNSVPGAASMQGLLPDIV